MKNRLIVILSLLVFALVPFNTNAQSSPENATKPVKCAVKLNFGSAGAGIDGKTYNAVKELITEKKLKFTEKVVGMEGETEICMPLKELKKSQKTEFIKRLKSITSQGQFISLSTS